MESTPAPIPPQDQPHAPTSSGRPGRLFRVFAHCCWLSFVVAMTLAVVIFLVREIPKSMFMPGFLLIILIALLGWLAGIVALCGLKAYGRKGILWPALVGFFLWLVLIALMVGSQLLA